MLFSELTNLKNSKRSKTSKSTSTTSTAYAVCNFSAIQSFPLRFLQIQEHRRRLQMHFKANERQNPKIPFQIFVKERD